MTGSSGNVPPTEPARGSVLRVDDNDNEFVVADALNETAAKKLVAEFEARGHKQVYWAEREAEAS